MIKTVLKKIAAKFGWILIKRTDYFQVTADIEQLSVICDKLSDFVLFERGGANAKQWLRGLHTDGEYKEIDQCVWDFLYMPTILRTDFSAYKQGERVVVDMNMLSEYAQNILYKMSEFEV